MTKALVLDPFSGVSGDMFLGALVDVGADFEKIRGALLAIPELGSVKIERERVSRGPITATRVKITCPHEHAHRSLSTIRKIIQSADLAPSVKRGAVKTFELLAKAEAKVHGADVEAVHFHEVGALDAICDIVGAHLALDLLGGPACFTTELSLGTGATQSEHGAIPVPAPATVELLAGHRVKLTDRTEELVTPTGAAIVASTCKPLPRDATVTPQIVGYGAGARGSEGLPNVLRAIAGTVDETKGRVCIITSTIDDMNPEVYGYVMDKLLERGALEVYYNPVMMKKNRPGLEVTVITEEADLSDIANYLMSSTTTLGVRIHREDRLELPRHRDTVDTPYGSVDVKVAERPDGTRSMSPEYESCRAVAERAKVALIDVYEAARQAWKDKARQD